MASRLVEVLKSMGLNVMGIEDLAHLGGREVIWLAERPGNAEELWSLIRRLLSLEIGPGEVGIPIEVYDPFHGEAWDHYVYVTPWSIAFHFDMSEEEFRKLWYHIDYDYSRLRDNIELIHEFNYIGPIIELDGKKYRLVKRLIINYMAKIAHFDTILTRIPRAYE